MGRRRKNSVLDEILGGLFEIAGVSWHFGAVVTIIFAALTLKAFFWMEGVLDDPSKFGNVVGAMLEQMGALAYIFPGIVGFLAFIFALQTYSAYAKSKRLA